MQKKTCETCKWCRCYVDGAGFRWYYCELWHKKDNLPGRMIVGRSNYLDGVEFSEACDRYEEGKGK